MSAWLASLAAAPHRAWPRAFARTLDPTINSPTSAAVNYLALNPPMRARARKHHRAPQPFHGLSAVWAYGGRCSSKLLNKARAQQHRLHRPAARDSTRCREHIPVRCSANSARRRALLLDDPKSRPPPSRMLQSLGAIPTKTVRAYHAWRRNTGSKFDSALCRLHFPEGDGGRLVGHASDPPTVTSPNPSGGRRRRLLRSQAALTERTSPEAGVSRHEMTATAPFL